MSHQTLKFLIQQLRELAAHKALTPDYIKKLTQTVQDVEKYMERARPK